MILILYFINVVCYIDQSVCRIILVPLQWAPLDCEVLFFKSIVVLCLLGLCLGFLHLYSPEIFSVIFCVLSLPSFGIRVVVASYNVVGSYCLFFSFLKECERVGTKSSFSVW